MFKMNKISIRKCNVDIDVVNDVVYLCQKVVTGVFIQYL